MRWIMSSGIEVVDSILQSNRDAKCHLSKKDAFATANNSEYRKERFMASCTSIHGSPVGAFKHDLRERDVYKNEDIDKSKSHLNYSLSEHGKTSAECMNYYDSLLDGVYHRGGSTVTSAEWAMQAPDDLAPELREEFFKSTYEFLNEYNFSGDDTRCILAEVHRDEIGAEHLHYVFTFPVVQNEKFIDFKSKMADGAKQIQSKYSFDFMGADKEKIRECYSVIQRYEARSDTARERETIKEIGRILDLKRDDARWCFTRMKRTDAEKYETKLMSKDTFLSKEYFDNFHPAYQKWLNDHGFNCTVYRGGGGINLTVEQLKEITRQTGIKLERGLSVDSVSKLINENVHLKSRVEELEKQVSREQPRSWGSVSGWGNSNREVEINGKDKEIDY